MADHSTPQTGSGNAVGSFGEKENEGRRALTKSYKLDYLVEPVSNKIPARDDITTPQVHHQSYYVYNTVPSQQSPYCTALNNSAVHRQEVKDSLPMTPMSSHHDRTAQLPPNQSITFHTAGAGAGAGAAAGTCIPHSLPNQMSCLQEDEGDDSDSSVPRDHANRFPVAIEYHNSRQCSYTRQQSRSGTKVKIHQTEAPNYHFSDNASNTQYVKFYQKHLVRICRCGQYTQMDGALVQGRTNDCDGYEIHYSQKCKWKAYDDFKTGARVLIRLCKCY